MNVPFVDLKAQYESIKPEIDRAIARIIEETAFIGGWPVKEFESAFTRAYGVNQCVSCANGTDAIYIALKMLGIGLGDEVVTTAHSWISTSEVISQTGARPVFVDVDDYYHLDVNRLEEAVTAQTRAVIPVHLYGQPADMPKIMEIAGRYDLKVIEDCAQAHFAEIEGRRVGTFGDAATFSFYPGKNLGAYGDAGAIITNDEALATSMRMYANHGALNKHDHRMEGINSRLDGIQAAVLSVKLPHLHEWTRARQQVASWYDERLSRVDGITVPQRRAGSSHVFHLYVIEVSERDSVRQYLAEHGIQTAVHYPVAIPLMPAYAYLGHEPESFPRARVNQDRILSLPIFPEMSLEQVDYVVEHLQKCVS